MEELLQQILKEIGKINTRLDSMEARMDRMEARMDHMEARMDSIETRVDDTQQMLTIMRQQQVVFEQRFDEDMTALKDMHRISMDYWEKSMDIFGRVERLLDDRKVEVVAVEARVENHENRIVTLEQRAG